MPTKKSAGAQALAPALEEEALKRAALRHMNPKVRDALLGLTLDEMIEEERAVLREEERLARLEARLSAQVLSQTGEAPETQEQRRASRYQMCIDAGLQMPDNDYARLPKGIGKLAAALGITHQAFSEDVKAHIRSLRGK